MSDNVQVSVRSGLSKVIEELNKIRDAASDVSTALGDAGKDAGDSLNKQAKRTETFFGQLRSATRRIADQMRGDFKSLLALNALTDSLKLSNQFKGVLSESVTLGDTIRKLGRTFGVAGGDFAKFQSLLTKGLGEIGLSSDVASRTLEGLADTTVRGQGNVLGYSKTAGQLASITNQKGQEGGIASGIANTIRARGGNANDLKQMEAVAEDLRRIFNQTGKGPTETLKVMEEIFSKMPEDLRKQFSSKGIANIAAAAQVGGPNATKFIEDYLSQSPIARKAFEAQGGKGIVSNEGIDIEKFRNFSKNIVARVGGDPRLAAKTLGLSDEAAEGFIRLSESLDKVKQAQDAVKSSTGDIATQYKASLGLGESFKANINRIKGLLAEPLSKGQQGLTDLLSKASGSDAGAGAVVAGGGVLAALLAGIGLRGVGGGLAKGAVGGALAKQAGATPVWVVNASEIGGGGVGGGIVDKAVKAATAVASGGALVAGTVAATAAIATGGAAYLINKESQAMEPGSTPLTPDQEAANKAINDFFSKLKSFFTGEGPKVKVELNKRELKESRQPTRGASYGP